MYGFVVFAIKLTYNNCEVELEHLHHMECDTPMFDLTPPDN